LKTNLYVVPKLPSLLQPGQYIQQTRQLPVYMHADQAQLFQRLEDTKSALNNHDLRQKLHSNPIINVTAVECENFTLKTFLKRHVCTEQNSMKRDSLFIKNIFYNECDMRRNKSALYLTFMSNSIQLQDLLQVASLNGKRSVNGPIFSQNAAK